MSFKDSAFYRTAFYLLYHLLVFLSRLLKSLWVFFPGILFVVLAMWCFWTLGQGKDIIVAFTENSKAKAFFFIAIAFWIYVSWYSARIVSYLKKSREEDYIKKVLAEYPPDEAQKKLDKAIYFELPPAYLKTFPRLIGFACLLAIELAVLQSPVLGEKAMMPGKAGLYFLLGLIISWGLDDIVNNFSDKKRKAARTAFYSFLVIFVAAAVWVILNPNSGLVFLFWVLLILHLVFLFYINIRRKQVERYEREAKPPKPVFFIRWSYKVMDFMRIPRAEIGYFLWFNIVCGTGLIVYVSAISSMDVSWRIGPFPFVLLAFAVLLGFGNIVTAFSVKANVNFHALIFLAALVLGSGETHYIRTKTIDQEERYGIYNQRQNIQTYFTNWVNNHAAEIDSTTGSYPVYFVLANGGASRSGYWTASVLSKLEDESNGTSSPFSRHLFCLSGTSGGGVGVATFFSLLNERKKLDDPAPVSYLEPAKSFLKQDFLTHTLAYMLGPDYFKYIFHINSRNFTDRAGALEKTIEEGARRDSGILKVVMDEPFSNMLALNNNPHYDLPVLCINTTRMQDGNPGVVTNIALDRATFNNRVDVSGILMDSLDMRLSTASILGARFPYISPAGRIDEWLPKRRRFNEEDSIQAHYFVDGGYFDNSGAGVVQEMIRAMLNYSATSTDSVFKTRVRKLRFTILHITNSPQGVIIIKPVSPVKNDLLAPIVTIAGAYDMQTTVNDNRLENFIEDIRSGGIVGGAEYYPIHLYKDSEERRQDSSAKDAPYAMNWFISDTTLKRMDNRLMNQPKLKALINRMKQNQ